MGRGFPCPTDFMGLRERRELPSRVRGRAVAENGFQYFLAVWIGSDQLIHIVNENLSVVSCVQQYLGGQCEHVATVERRLESTHLIEQTTK